MKHIKDIDRTNKTFRMDHNFIHINTECKNLSDDDFETLLSNMEGILEHIDAYTINPTYQNPVASISLMTLKSHPQPIMDFGKFLGYVTSLYRDNLHYYSSAFEKSGQWSFFTISNAIGAAEKATIRTLSEILSQ